MSKRKMEARSDEKRRRRKKKKIALLNIVTRMLKCINWNNKRNNHNRHQKSQFVMSASSFFQHACLHLASCHYYS